LQEGRIAGLQDGRGVTPSSVTALMRDRTLRLAAGLAVVVAIPVAILFYFQYRSITALSQSSTLVLRQLSQETADAVTKALVDSLRTVRVDVLLKVGQRQTEPLDLAYIENTFEQGLVSDLFVDRFYVWSDVTSQYRGQVLAYDRKSYGFIVNPPESKLLVKRFHDLAPEQRAIAIFDGDIGGRRTHFQGQLRFTFTRDRLTSFVALAVDAERLRAEFVPQLLASKFPRIEGPIGFPPLAVTVLDGTNRVVYPAGSAATDRFVDERTLPLVFFDAELVSFAAPETGKPETWRVRTGYGNQAIPDIIARRERPQLIMMGVLASLMALGVFIIARAAARELRVAEMKSNFVSSVSHDLKTPLALIQLFAETLELGRLKNTERAPEYYRIINSEARKLTRLINNLLDFSKIEAGLRKYQLEPTDLTAVARRVVDSLESQFRHNQFSVSLRAPQTPIAVKLDAEAAEQALENLLSNAMKYSPEHREIIVEVDRTDRYGVVRVRDRGIGIAPRQQRRIFQKFYRVQTDAGTGPQGTGLGLAIVDHVMRAHGGFVQVDSEPGRGSTFTLHFPLYPGDINVDETDSGDRGRTADVARSA
jgi:signal transduction histidine kinase